jgi:hypothetical protein
VPAIIASMLTEPMVVRLIHRSARPVMPRSPARTHRTAHIGLWVRSDQGDEHVAYRSGPI